jgi:Ca2+-binding EF-hand superfamily protein
MRLCSFEKEVLRKLTQKTTGGQNEETVLRRAFKYFDTDNSGSVNMQEFQKAVEKVGILIPTFQDLQVIFNIYDVNQNGDLDYNEFASIVTGRSQVSGATPRASQQSSEQLMQRIKQKMKGRGIHGIIGLARNFKIMDDNHSMTLDKHEFAKAADDFMLGLNKQELEQVFQSFDVNGDGLISYDEFLRQVRGPMNPRRSAIVDKAFDKLDKDGNGHIDVNDMIGVYDASHHPEFKQGKKTEQQVFQDWLRTFQTHHECRNNNAPDHIVTREEFQEYYNNISCSIDDDQYFLVMMNNCWNLDGSMDVNKRRGTATQVGKTMGMH